MCNATATIKRLALLSLLAISSMSVSAQLTLGYCDEEGYSGSLSNSNTHATISCAMGLTPALQADYTFCSISYLRIYLTAPENLTSFIVWVRNDLEDDDDLASIDVEPSALTEGWNDIALPRQIELTGNEIYYCGYSYTQSTKTRIPLSGTKGTAESFYVSTGNGWRDMSGQYAPVCIRVGLSSNYQYAMELTDLRLAHRWYDINCDDDTVTIQGAIRNLGNEPLTHFTVTVQEDARNTFTSEFDCTSADFGYSVLFEFRFLRNQDIHLTNPDIPVVATVSQPNGQDNQCDHKTNCTVYYELGESNPDPRVPANLLIEEFTSEANGYAPAGQTHLRNSIVSALDRLEDIEPDVILLSRHEGYGPADTWRIAGSDYKASFFGEEELTYAPAAMVCRNGLPFSTTLDEDSIAQLISERFNIQYGIIQYEDATFDVATHTISATVLTHLFGISIYRNPTLVVCVKQDKVASVAQKNYYPELYEDGWQLDVVRQFLTLPGQGRLLGDLDSEAVATGLVKVSDLVNQQFVLSESIPSDITSGDGLTLVAYIYDKDYSNKIIAASQVKITSKTP
ncbi:MAG: hypothetical protein IKX59_05685 [Bacteroidales bacterium]|nr:hypothetical protein [Bacteroidales bacterium]